MATTFRMHADAETYNQDGFVAKVGMEIHFDLQITPGEFMRVSDDLRPVLLDHERITGYIRSDGRMYDKRALRSAPYDLQDPGELGVELLSNSPYLNLESDVTYRVTPEMPGERTTFTPFYIDDLPADGTPQNLASLAPGPGQSVIGDARGRPGPANVLTIGDVQTGASLSDADATISGESPGQQLNLVIPRGAEGPPGPLGVVLTYRGLWNASANSPTLADGVGIAGDTWLASTSGTFDLGSGDLAFAAGDYAAFNGVTWEPIPAALVAAAGQIVKHGSDANYPRPGSAVVVLWDGDVEPNLAVNGDWWGDTAGDAPAISTTVLNSLNQGAIFSQMLVAAGSTPITWSVTAGTLPAGLTFSTDGNLYGTPSATGAYDFTVEALNGFGTDTQQYTGTVGSAIGPTILTTSLGPVVAGTAFSLTLSASGSATITYALAPGSDPLPDGLSLDGDTGAITGTPTTTGSYIFTIRATNGVGYDDQAFSGTITGVAPTITTTSLNPLWRGFAFSQTIAAIGTPPLTWSQPAGSYPAGISLSGATLSGTPSATGPYDFTLRAHNAYSPDDDQVFTGSVLESTPAIVETSLGAITISTPFSQTLTLSTGGPTITWSEQSGSLPAGLSLNPSTGAITGTPTATGAYSVTIRATNGTDYDDQAFTGSVSGLLPTFDAVGVGGYADSSGYTSYTHTVGSNNSTVIVAIATYPYFTGTVTTVTCGGVAMTYVDKISQGSFSSQMDVYYYKLTGVSAGSKTIAVQTSGANGATSVNSVSVVNGTAGAAQKIGGTGASFSQTISCAAGELIVQSLAALGTGGMGTFAGGTKRWDGYVDSPPYKFCNLSLSTATETTTFTAVSTGGDQSWAGMGVVFSA
ncbi:Ig domain-containing protein [Mycobacterium sp. CVI_P3]|uniref:Ig domain-containing protein n=1 Tax=Mycobacterium pinniadriaticum TaxID=2994102 RepID=A0ABT3SE99_9MYCO|nr:Ig domain-containing protein [Mycobacterium pinniadriaticum]MCX2931421.1 Ig domain-containing protein [Mycobacterium pinniadriaticum]MCX2937845.1 Ig domain-containing protein [Mycobacterium pinniadriaticum]